MSYYCENCEERGETTEREVDRLREEVERLRLGETASKRELIKKGLTFLEQFLGPDGKVNATLIRRTFEAQRAEIARLTRMLDDPGTTHAEGCATWGPKHWQCALNERDALLARVEAAEAQLRNEI